MLKVIAICGKSGAGKDSILREIISQKPEWKEIVSHTTRPRREYEIEGEDYYFVSDKDFQNMCDNGDMLEYTEFNTWHYGTARSSLAPNTINVGVFNPEGLRHLMAYNGLEVIPIYIVADDKVRLKRCLDRELKPDVAEIIRRYGTDEEDFKDIFERGHRLFMFHNEVYNTPEEIATEIIELFGQKPTK